jgi:pyruvate formate-lyase/glycerol dehydratase family glycyl radical enzyme
MSQRTDRLREQLHVKKFPLSIEKLKLVTESYMKSEGQPEIMRRALALENVLKKIPIFIPQDELIVGNGSSKPMGLEMDCDYGIWTQDEVNALKEENYIIQPDDETRLQEMNEFWKGQTLINRYGVFLGNDRMFPFMQSGVVLPPWKSNIDGSGGGYAQSGMGLGPGFYLACFDFAKVINGGLNRIISEAETELQNTRYTDADSVEKVHFLRAVIVANKSVIEYAGRFGDLAEKMAREEKDARRSLELKRIAETCRRVPANPARTFIEAIQSFWFMFLMVTPSPTAAAGRFDQYMYPFYRDDIKSGKLMRDEALELLVCLRIKDMQLNRTSGKINRRKNAGMAKWHNWTMGGVNEKGEDVTNDLDYLLLEAALECPTPHPTMTLRIHEKTPEELMVKALEVVRTGIGMPAFIGDKSYIAYLLHHDIPMELARDYVMTGCIDVNLVGKSRIATYGMFIVPLVFDIFLHNGIEPRTGRLLGIPTGNIEDFKTFKDFLAAFEKQLEYFMTLASERNNVELYVEGKWYCEPLRSSLMDDWAETGKDILQRPMLFENGAVLNAIGIINVADALAAVKKLVYDDKKVTLLELKEAMAANWQSKHFEDIRKMCLAAPKYGNDDTYVDGIAAELYRFWVEIAGKLGTVFGGKNIPTAISISSQWPGGELTGATPDGRYAGDCLADGTMSAMRGMDTHGPTALIKSAVKIDQESLQATLMNMKFHPSSLKTTDDLKKLASLIKTYFELGGKHVQFNVVNRDVLVEAQRKPEEHRDLVVRVAGYSAYFIQLGQAVQDEIIGRTEHKLKS